jgi:DedD protein
MTESRLTQRLVGAIVLVALMVIFVPLLFEKEEPTPTIELPAVPPVPTQEIPLPPPVIIPLDRPQASLPPPPELTDETPGTTSPDAGTPSGDEASLDQPTPVGAGEPPAEDEPSEPGLAAAEQESLPAEPEAPASSAAPPQAPPRAATPRPAPSAQARSNDTLALARPREAGASAPVPTPTLSDVKRKEPSGWVVQVATFKNSESAMELRDRLQRMGHKVFIEVIQQQGESLYRVRVGPENERGEADQIRQALAKEFSLDPLVMSYP